MTVIPGRRPRIVVLNDSPEMLDLYRDMLMDEGYIVRTELKLLATVNELLAFKPDLLVLDFLWGKDQSGLFFLVQLRNDPRTATLPVILCTTGTTEVSILHPHLDRLQVTIITKPFHVSSFLEAVRSAVATSGAEHS